MDGSGGGRIDITGTAFCDVEMTTSRSMPPVLSGITNILCVNVLCECPSLSNVVILTYNSHLFLVIRDHRSNAIFILVVTM